MAITTCGNCIEFGTCTMCATPTGFSFNGEFCAAEGFCDYRAFGGYTNGYSMGGNTGTAGGCDFVDLNLINKFPFSSDSNATNVANLLTPRSYTAGHNSDEDGYVTGGRSNPSTYNDLIQRFSFSSESPAVDAGELIPASPAGFWQMTGVSSATNGYALGGKTEPSAIIRDFIQKFPFSSTTTASDIGEMSTRFIAAGVSSTTNGYQLGGGSSPTVRTNTIQKMSFIVDAPASTISNLSGTVAGSAGQSSPTHGYNSGGFHPPTTICSGIDKFPFANDTPASGIGNLAVCGGYVAGQSSITDGYVTGGFAPPQLAARNNIQKFPFSSDSNATDIADLTFGSFAATGVHV